MKRVLFDTNVVLDVLLDRLPHADASSSLWAAIEAGSSEGMISAHALTTVHYFLKKQIGNTKAQNTIATILKVFSVAEVNGAVLQEALQLNFTDFEDAVTTAAARFAKCGFIVTRDPKGFRNSPVRCLNPEQLLQLLEVGKPSKYSPS